MDNCDIKCCNLFLFMQNIKAFKLILLFPLDWRIFIFLANIFLFARKRLTSKSISNLQYSWQIKITVVVIVIAISSLSFTFCNFFWWCLQRRQVVVFAIIVVNIFVFIFVNLSFPTFWVVSSPEFVVAERKGLATLDLGGTEVPRRQWAGFDVLHVITKRQHGMLQFTRTISRTISRFGWSVHDVEMHFFAASNLLSSALHPGGVEHGVGVRQWGSQEGRMEQ